tara:strand:- start:924 stop:1511 length:588 start_codon:yes stop_codon:yes gene_type:complete
MSNTTKFIKVKELKSNSSNPRVIRDNKFKDLVESIKGFPEMLEIRPIIINKKNLILGGNMRFRASIEAGLKEVPVKIVDLTPKKEKEFIIRDNVNSGVWDYDVLANEWDDKDLVDWGMETFMFGTNDNSLDLDERFEVEEELKDHKITDDGYVRFEIVLPEEDKKNLINLISNIKKELKISSADAFIHIIKSFKS